MLTMEYDKAHLTVKSGYKGKRGRKVHHLTVVIRVGKTKLSLVLRSDMTSDIHVWELLKDSPYFMESTGRWS